MGSDKSRLRVLVVGLNYEPETTGIAPYTSGMARALAERGHRVRVLTGYPHYPQWRVRPGYTGLTRTERLGDVSVTRLRGFVPRRPRTLDRLIMELTFGLRVVLARWGRPDVVVVVSPALIASLATMIRARLHGIPVVTWVQDIYTLGIEQTSSPGSGGPTGVVRRIEQRLLTGSSAVVVIHDRFKTYLTRAFAVAAPITVVRNWSHVEPAPEVDRALIRARLGWAEDEVVVLHAGNMGAKQGLENVVRASRVAADRGAPMRFVLMGDGLRRHELEAMDPNPCLQFIPPQPAGLFEQTLAVADVLLVNELPGLTEMSVPSKLTTYWATGRPVLAAVDSSSTTAEELVTSGAGVIVAPAMPERLVDAVAALVDDPERCRELASAGYEFRRRNLGSQAGVAGFEAVLESVTRPTRVRVTRRAA